VQTSNKTDYTLQPVKSTEFESWTSVNNLLNAEGFQALPLQHTDKGVYVAPEKLSELVVALVNRTKQFEKKL